MIIMAIQVLLLICFCFKNELIPTSFVIFTSQFKLEKHLLQDDRHRRIQWAMVVVQIQCDRKKIANVHKNAKSGHKAQIPAYLFIALNTHTEKVYNFLHLNATFHLPLPNAQSRTSKFERRIYQELKMCVEFCIELKWKLTIPFANSFWQLDGGLTILQSAAAAW